MSKYIEAYKKGYEDALASKGVKLIAKERARQIAKEGWTKEHDKVSHPDGGLALAAACYASPAPIYYYNARVYQFLDPFPFDKKWDKRGKHSYKRKLEIAGALIAAELDRIEGE